MTKRTKSVLQFVLFLSLGILLLWLALRGVVNEKEKIIQSFKDANYFWVFISLVAAFFGLFLRAYRWKYLLQPLGLNLSLKNSFAAVSTGYLANYGLPRMGEISRCTIISKYEKIPFQTALGTVITERIVDFFLLIIIFLLTLLFQFSELIGLTQQYILNPLSLKLKPLSQNPVFITIVATLLVLVVLAFLLLRKKIKNSLSGKFGGILKGFAEGISSIRKMDKPIPFIILSVLIWLMYFLGIYFCFFTFGETSDLGLKQCLTILLFGTFGVIFTPGGIGAYHIIVQQILMFYSISSTTSFAFPWIIWGSQFILILIAGLASIIALPLMNKQNHAAA